MQIEELNLDALELKYEMLRARVPRVEKNLLVSIGELGQKNPVIVVRGSRAGFYVVIDGHKRVRALKKLKRDVARAAVWEMSEEEALAVNYELSRSGGKNAVEEGWLVQALHDEWKWSLNRIGERLMKSKSWVSRRLSLVEEMPEWIARAVSQGEIGAHAAVTYLAPLTRGNARDGKILTEKICGLGLTSRQIRDLCQNYRRLNGAARQRIVADPLLFLKAQSAANQGKQDSELSAEENRCARNLELVGHIALGLTRSLPQALRTDGAEPARQKLGTRWAECAERFGILAKTAGALFRESPGRDGG